jgi:hypothetical protein
MLGWRPSIPFLHWLGVGGAVGSALIVLWFAAMVLRVVA